jgi:hypothetical protein
LSVEFLDRVQCQIDILLGRFQGLPYRFEIPVAEAVEFPFCRRALVLEQTQYFTKPLS